MKTPLGFGLRGSEMSFILALDMIIEAFVFFLDSEIGFV